MSGSEFFLMVIALALSLIAIFFCVALFYVILILKRVHGMMDTLERFSVQCCEGWTGVITRVNAIKDSIQLIGQGLQTAQQLYHRYTEQPKKGKKKSDHNDSGSEPYSL